MKTRRRSSAPSANTHYLRHQRCPEVCNLIPPHNSEATPSNPKNHCVLPRCRCVCDSTLRLRAYGLASLRRRRRSFVCKRWQVIESPRTQRNYCHGSKKGSRVSLRKQTARGQGREFSATDANDNDLTEKTFSKLPYDANSPKVNSASMTLFGHVKDLCKTRYPFVMSQRAPQPF